MKKILLTLAIALLSSVAFSQDATFEIFLQNTKGGKSVILVEDYGNSSYVTVNSKTVMKITRVEDTAHGIKYTCIDEGGCFQIELNFEKDTFKVWLDYKLTVTGKILTTSAN